MKPHKGDYVKLTYNFINNNSSLPWVGSLKDVELYVTKVVLKSMNPNSTWDVFFISNGLLNHILINDMGYFVASFGVVSNYIVFELSEEDHDSNDDSDDCDDCDGDDCVNSNNCDSSKASWKPISSIKSQPIKKEETNTTCVMCGSPALDLLFSVRCINPKCKNYK